MSPTGRSLNLLRRDGWLPAVVEKWLPWTQHRSDLWGFADILAVHAKDRAFLLVQTTSIDHVAHRLTKAKGRAELGTWLAAGGMFEVHGWVKRNGRWSCRRVSVQAGDMADVVIQAPPRKCRRSRWQAPDLFALA